MGKYSEAIKAKLATLGKAKVGNVEDFVKDPENKLNEIYLENDEFFVRGQISKKMEESFAKLTPEKQEEINALDLPDEEKWLIAADAFETQFGKEAADKLADEITGIVSPSDPRYPPQKRDYVPIQKEINDLRLELQADDPQLIEKMELLGQVEKDLTLASDEVLGHYNRLDDKILDRVNSRAFVEIKESIDSFEGGKYASKMPQSKTKYLQMNKYDFDAVSPEKCTFSVEDGAELAHSLKNPISPELQKDVLGITDTMEKNKEGYVVPGVTVMSKHSHYGHSYHWSEHGTKAYAFWPLQKAYIGLEDAVKSKDFDKIRKAQQNYAQQRKIADDMMQTVGKYKTPLCSANANSTRGGNIPIKATLSGAQGRVAIPGEYMKDFLTHSKLNGLYMFHAFSKNSGVTPEELLNNPADAMRRSANKYLQDEGLHNKPLGARLYNSLSEETGPSLSETYSYALIACATRAFEAVASMEKDPKERKAIQGYGALGVAAGTIVVNDYISKLYELSKMDAAKRERYYQYAALLPDDEFDPVKLHDQFFAENWQEATDPKKLVAGLRAKGKLDFAALSERTGQIFEEIQEEADRDDAVNFSNFNSEKFYEASMKAYQEVLRTATPEEQKDPAFLKFRDEVNYGLPLKCDQKCKEDVQRLDENIAFQQQKKSGWFMSSTNSPEHERMVVAQRKLQYKLRQLRGDAIEDLPEDELEALKNADLKKLIDGARKHTYEYCRLKTDNGKSGFLHTAGADRYNNAFDSLSSIDGIAEQFGMMSPGQKLMNDTKNELLNKRSDKAWARRVAETAAAREILGMTLANGKKSFAEQRTYMEEPKLTATVEIIKADPAFKRMMRNVGVDQMIDNIVLGKTAVTDAYIKAKSQIEQEKAPERDRALGNNVPAVGNDDIAQTMNNEEKRKMWEDNPIKV